MKLELLEEKSQVLKINNLKTYEKNKAYKQYYSRAVINSLPMIEIDPLTNMFKSNPNVKKR